MKRQEWLLAAVALAAVAYSVHGLVTETGAVGWLNHVQQSLFGAYSLKVSAVLVISGLMFLAVAGWSMAARLGGGSDGGLMRRFMFGPGVADKAAQPVSARSMWMIGLGLVVATWVVGYAVQAWLAGLQREDATAHYEPIVLGDDAAAPQPRGTHVRLQGRLLGDHVLTHRSGSGSSASVDYHLVPVAGPGWRPGQPVSYVVKVKQLVELPGQKPRAVLPPGAAVHPVARDALLGRLDGEVPVPAAQEFRKSGVALTANSHLLRLVPSKGDLPDVRDSSAEDFQIYLILCAGISVVLLLLFGLTSWLMARQRRQMATRPGPAGGR